MLEKWRSLDAEGKRRWQEASRKYNTAARARRKTVILCGGCGKEFVHFPHRKTCSPECRQIAWQRYQDNYRETHDRSVPRKQKTCRICRELFMGHKRETLCGSEECKVEAQRQATEKYNSNKALDSLLQVGQELQAKLEEIKNEQCDSDSGT